MGRINGIVDVLRSKVASSIGGVLPLAVPNAKGTKPTVDAGTRGRMILFEDADWGSKSSTYDLSAYLPGARHPISGAALNKASILAYNFPIGFVCTLTQNQAAGVDRRAGSTDPNLKLCGTTLDLVGTGKTEYVDLHAHSISDCVSCFFYRHVNFSLGVVELYDGENYSGNRVILFLSEWASGAAISFDGWFINKRISSSRFGSLSDLTTAAFTTVDKFSMYIFGGSSINNIPSFKVWEKMNDKITSFVWNDVLPIQEVIGDFDIKIPASTGGGTSYSVSMQGTNKSSCEQVTTVNLERESTTSLQLTVETSTTNSFESSLEVSVSGGGIFGGVESTATFTYRRDMSKRKENSTTETLRVNTAVAQQVTIPPMSKWNATLTVNVAKVPVMPWTAKAIRWYDVAVPGSAPDPDRPGLFVREETLNGTVSGGIAGAVVQFVEATPL